jgi:hypothetical protein
MFWEAIITAIQPLRVRQLRHISLYHSIETQSLPRRRQLYSP